MLPGNPFRQDYPCFGASDTGSQGDDEIAIRHRSPAVRCVGGTCPQSAVMNTGQTETNQQSTMPGGDNTLGWSTGKPNNTCFVRHQGIGWIPAIPLQRWVRDESTPIDQPALVLTDTCMAGPCREGSGAPEPSPAWPHGMVHGIRPGVRGPGRRWYTDIKAAQCAANGLPVRISSTDCCFVGSWTWTCWSAALMRQPSPGTGRGSGRTMRAESCSTRWCWQHPRRVCRSTRVSVWPPDRSCGLNQELPSQGKTTASSHK